MIICYNLSMDEQPQNQPTQLGPDQSVPPEMPMQVETPQTDSEKQVSIHWQASEFVMHHKPAWWYAAFVAVALALAMAFFFILRDLIAAIAILVVFGLAFSMATKNPRTLDYALDESGITVGEQTHAYTDFRSFSVVRDGALDSIFLYPLQRFAMPIIIYFAPEDSQSIVDALSFHLPHEEREMSFIDKLSRNLRF